MIDEKVKLDGPLAFFFLPTGSFIVPLAQVLSSANLIGGSDCRTDSDKGLKFEPDDRLKKFKTCLLTRTDFFKQ